MKYVAFMLLITSLILGSSGYWYYIDSQARIEQLRENNVKLEQANKSNLETIEQMKLEAEKMAKANAELSAAKEAADAKVRKLSNIFSDLNLLKQAIDDPAATEEKINNGTKKILQRLRDITAAPRNN